MRPDTLLFISNGLACFALGVSLCTLIHNLEPVPEPEPEPVVQVDTLTDWQKLQMAIIFTESKGNPCATGKTQDIGIYQITPIYVAEVNRIAGTNYTHEDAYDVGKSLEMFAIVQDYYNPEHDTDIAIKIHNPGGASIGYPAKVKSNIEFIKRYEAARRAVKDYELRKGI